MQEQSNYDNHSQADYYDQHNNGPKYDYDGLADYYNRSSNYDDCCADYNYNKYRSPADYEHNPANHIYKCGPEDYDDYPDRDFKHICRAHNNIFSTDSCTYSVIGSPRRDGKRYG